jgi:hypothetical protein
MLAAGEPARYLERTIAVALPEHPRLSYLDPQARRAEPSTDASSLAHLLEPALRDHCKGRLSEITWFQAAWSNSGSATGSAAWHGEDGPVDVIVKLPLGPAEFTWTTRLGDPALGAPTPRVFASDVELAHYDFAWIVEERVKGEALKGRLKEGDALDVLRVAADFHAATIRVHSNPDAPKPLDWVGTLQKAREVCRANAIADSQRWNEAIKQVTKFLPKLMSRWESRPLNCWCHGDLHPGNVMRLVTPRDPSHTCVLIDLGMVHAGHWIEDAVYLERQYWAAPQYLHGVRPVIAMANLRRERGMPVDSDYPEYANLRRVFMAAVSPAFMDREGHPKYLSAALDVLERTLPQVLH